MNGHNAAKIPLSEMSGGATPFRKNAAGRTAREIVDPDHRRRTERQPEKHAAGAHGLVERLAQVGPGRLPAHRTSSRPLLFPPLRARIDSLEHCGDHAHRQDQPLELAQLARERQVALDLRSRRTQLRVEPVLLISR
jgi:hypothetical protein